MEKINNIKYKLVEYDTSYGSTRLEIHIQGDNINHIILNTIRRTILTDIPIYAFTTFNFKKNTSIFNNNYIKLRLKNLPVWGIKNNIKLLDKKKIETLERIEEEEEEEYENDDIDINHEEESNKDLNSSSLNQLTMYIDYTNKINDIVTVTTDDAKFYFAENNITNPYKVPIPIIKLQPNQIINFSAITTLDIEKTNTIFSAVSVCFYKQITPNEYNFIVESRGQISEKQIINVGIINILKKLENIPNMIPEIESQNMESQNKGEIIILNEDSTLGNLLSYGMQIHKNVKFAGYNIPHLLDTKVVIHYELDEKIKLKKVINDVINYYNEIFNTLLELNEKIKI
jgi:DNA-directed RNA polymerase subunit L